MGAVRVQATIEENDMPYVERFLKGIAYDFSFDENDDFFNELSQEDLKSIEISKEQIKKGLFVSNKDTFQRN